MLKKSKNNKWDSENDSNGSDQEMQAESEEEYNSDPNSKSKKETIYEEELRLKADFIKASTIKPQGKTKKTIIINIDLRVRE